MGRRLISNQFVGRVTELAELEAAAQAAAEHRPALVLLGGDSGVGKSRLISELEQRAQMRGALVLRGESVEQEDGELPYAPLTSALRPLVRSCDPVLEQVSRGSRAQLAALLPGLDVQEDSPEWHDPAAQMRLFEALLELLDLLSERQQTVLILEDLQWADRSTRTFVSFLARSLRRERVLTLLSYRSDDVHRRHPLRPLLSELDRLEHVRRIDLRPFSRGEMADLLTDILGSAPSEMLLERLYERSEGNALYAEELLAAGMDGRGAVPQSLHDAFMLRFERLSADAQRAVRSIAVGRSLEEAVIAQLTGIEGAALVAALREAVAEQVLVTDDEGYFRFRHALLREAVYDDLLPGERGELHRALARALEPRMTGNREQEAELAAAIAGHYAAAGDQAAALRTAVQAALAARDVHAYGEAAELAERALALWPRVPRAERTLPLSRVDLLRLAASAHSLAGNASRAEVLLEQALEEVDSADDVALRTGLLAQLARVRWSLNRGVEGVETAQRALALLSEGDTSRERAALMAWLVRTRFLRGRFREAIEDGEPALRAAVDSGDRHTEGEVLGTLGMARMSLGQVDEGAALLRRSIESSRETCDLDNLGYGYANLADMLHLAGRTEEALSTARQGLDAIPRRIGRLHDWLMVTVAQMAFEAGEWDEARAHLQRSSSTVIDRFIFRLVVEAELALAEGDDGLAEQRLREAEPLVSTSSEPQWIGTFGALSGELHRRRRDLLGARAAVEQALDRLDVCTDDVMRIARASAVGAGVEADIARRARDLRERGQERDALARLRIHAGRLGAAAKEGGPVERAWQAVGRAEMAAARGREEAGAWEEAARHWEAIGRPYRTAVARWREAEGAAGAGRPAEGSAAARAALATARRLGARWLTEEVEGLARRARLQLEEARDVSRGAGSADAGANGTQAPFDLTPRELQVLGLIAEGATNRQIGAALFMAEKTASVHVSRILSKLGVRSRTQAAALAHRLHLT